MDQMGWVAATHPNLEKWADEASEGIDAKSTMKYHESAIKKILDKWQNYPSTLTQDIQNEDDNDVDDLYKYLESNENSLKHLALQRRYTKLQTAARKFLLANSASLENFYKAVERHEAKLFTCEYNCGYIGSWEECVKHEISCTARKPRNYPDVWGAIDTRRNIKF
jgi:hypothetical protein